MPSSLALSWPGLILLAALLNLDRQVFGPFMLGRPLITGLVLGLVTGEVGSGVWMGLSAELLWLASLPLGGQITPNAGLAVSAAFIGWVKSGQAHTAAPGAESFQATLVIAFLAVPVWAKALGLVDLGCRRLMPKVLARVQADLAAGREPHFRRRNFYGLAVTLALSAAALAVAVLLNVQFIQAAAGLAPQALLRNLGLIFNLLPFAGLLGMAVFMEARAFPFYLGGLAASLLALAAV